MRQEKKLLLEEIKGKVEASKSFIVAKYENITALESRMLRRMLAKNAADMEVV